jgi:carbon storage regulator CsrA
MLVLSRKPNEEIVINGNIRIRVLGVHGGRIRLGIEAPLEIPVRRSELDARDFRCEFVPPPAHGDAVILAAG